MLDASSSSEFSEHIGLPRTLVCMRVCVRGLLILPTEQNQAAAPGVRCGSPRLCPLDIAFMADVVAVDKAEGGQGMVGALEGGHSCGAPGHALGPDEEASSAAEELVVELFPKALAEQVESKRVDTRVSECQDPSTNAGNEMQH